MDYVKAFDCVDHNKLWKILREMGIPDHLTCLLRNLYAGQEETVKTRHGTDWIQIGKGVCQDCILSPWLFNLHAEYIMRNAGLKEAPAGIKTAGRNINNFRYADGRKWRGTKKPLDESERGDWKSLASGPITSWDRWGNRGSSGWLYFWGLQNHCRWWLQPLS